MAPRGTTSQPARWRPETPAGIVMPDDGRFFRQGTEMDDVHSLTHAAPEKRRSDELSGLGLGIACRLFLGTLLHALKRFLEE
jgi:hypothetical protein